MPICGRINQICHLISSGIRLNFDRKSSHIALSYHLENEYRQYGEHSANSIDFRSNDLCSGKLKINKLKGCIITSEGKCRPVFLCFGFRMELIIIMCVNKLFVDKADKYVFIYTK